MRTGAGQYAMTSALGCGQKCLLIRLLFYSLDTFSVSPVRVPDGYRKLKEKITTPLIKGKKKLFMQQVLA